MFCGTLTAMAKKQHKHFLIFVSIKEVEQFNNYIIIIL